MHRFLVQALFEVDRITTRTKRPIALIDDEDLADQWEGGECCALVSMAHAAWAVECLTAHAAWVGGCLTAHAAWVVGCLTAHAAWVGGWLGGAIFCRK
eukprot:36880-Pelagomonas_calceolata.AAC.2